jgi:hypothetical protein
MSRPGRMTGSEPRPGAKLILGLALYVAILLALAYPCAGAERGTPLPWLLFFAPLSAVSILVAWDGPAGGVLAMFFGVALVWPLLGVILGKVPGARRRKVAVAFLLAHYAFGIALEAAGLNASQRETLAAPGMRGWVALSFAGNAAGQAFLWRSLRMPPGGSPRSKPAVAAAKGGGN